MSSGSARFLLVAATYLEVAPLFRIFNIGKAEPPRGVLIPVPDTDFEMVITGPGPVATAFFMTEALASKHFLAAVNIGIAGSFSPDFPPGVVCRVVRDRFADLGAESPGNGFIPGENLPFTMMHQFPFVDGWLQPQISPFFNLSDIPLVSAITASTVHTNPESALKLSRLFCPDLESMEGAAFFYVAMMKNLPCLQIRAVSNFIAPRNPDNWHLDLALNNLNDFMSGILINN